ncbi:MAG: Crp/Fnr family transcriptional regulator [Candidatus Competibacteraceae bacterium]
MKSIALPAIWADETKCRYCAIRNSALFAGLEEKNFQHIHQPIKDVVLRFPCALYRMNEQGSTLFTLRGGVMKLVQYLPDGSQRIVRLLQGGDALGLEALVGQPYQHDAIALTDCEICAIPVEVIEKLGDEQPRLYRELMGRWQQALSEADIWLTQFTTGTARQRIARLLLRLTCPEQGHHLPLFGREDIGAMVGLTTETVSRTIAELRRQGLLRDRGANIQECNREMLRRIADGED